MQSDGNCLAAAVILHTAGRAKRQLIMQNQTMPCDPAAAESISTSLLGGVQVQDPRAWERLVALFSPFVSRWLRTWGVPESDAADVLQNIFARVAQNVQKFRREQPGDSFRGWLWTIARNQTSDFFRARPLHQASDSFLAQVPEVEKDDEATREQAELLYRLLETIRGDFQPSTFDVFWRCEIEGQSTEEVAAALGLKHSTIREARRRVKNRLREECQELLGRNEFAPPPST